MQEHSQGQFEGGIIHDQASLEAYPWPDPEATDVSLYLDGIHREIPPGMKLTLVSEGIYETLANLVGFESLCYLVIDQPELVDEICRRIGTRIVRVFERCVHHPVVGSLQICDDWGFKTGTFLSPDDLRRAVFPWHRAVVEVAHGADKAALLHACGDVSALMDDVIDALGFDAKHSYEDIIGPVEEMWRRYGRRIAILGGLDVDFLARSTPHEIYSRSKNLLELTGGRHYALGSGNSITPDVSWENYHAMLTAAWED